MQTELTFVGNKDVPPAEQVKIEDALDDGWREQKIWLHALVTELNIHNNREFIQIR